MTIDREPDLDAIEPEAEPDVGPDPAAIEPAPVAAQPARRWGTAMVAVMVLASGSVGAGLAHVIDGRDTITTASSASRALLLDAEGLDVAGIVARVGPAVVSVQVGYARFGGASGAGTGVILSADGEVLTNAHVVDGARSVTVTLAGESQARTAEVLGADRAADLALLKISGASGLPTAELGKSADAAVGDDVVAIGNALALKGGPTVTRGIISGLGRSLETDGGIVSGLIQTDASISSGNSGGPLVNARGQVIGINTAVAEAGRGASAENIGFAIASDHAQPVISRLRTGGPAAQTGYLGVRTTDPQDGSRGAMVSSVEPGSPAAGAGLQAGDLITHINGDTVDGASALSAAIQANGPGDSIEVRLIRASRTIEVKATLVTRPAA